MDINKHIKKRNTPLIIGSIGQFSLVTYTRGDILLTITVASENIPVTKSRRSAVRHRYCTAGYRLSGFELYS